MTNAPNTTHARTGETQIDRAWDAVACRQVLKFFEVSDNSPCAELG